MKKQLFHCLSAMLLGLVLAALALWLGAEAPAWADPGTLCVNTSGLGCDAACAGCYDSIQAAVNSASDGDEIRIAGGRYTDPAGTVIAIAGKELVIHGGYDQACANHAPDVHQTVLDAEWTCSRSASEHRPTQSLTATR